MGDWSDWNECAKDQAQKYRRRSISVMPADGGKTCDDILAETKPCDWEPDDAKVSEWSEWSKCDADCDAGEQTRSRKIIEERDAGGEGFAGELKEVRACPDLKACTKHVDCKWSDWQEWSACSCTCGGGSRARDRYIAVAPLGLGKRCEALDKSESGACNTKPCNACIDGEWESWSEWEDCSATCIGGVTFRTRKVKTSANECGKPPEGTTQETKPCNLGVSCSVVNVDCEFGQWTPWSGCSCSCDGWKERNRLIDSPGFGAGKFCKGPENEIAPCNVHAEGCVDVIENVDCVLGDWLVWGACDSKCGAGQHSRIRRVVTEVQGQGKGCSGALKETTTCDAGPCPEPKGAVDCVWGDWDKWGACTKCSGQRHRSRHIKQHSHKGGKPCDFGASSETTACDRACHEPYFCEWDTWSKWGDCSQTCGEGVRNRERALTAAKGKPVSDVELLPDLQQRLEAAETHHTQDLVLSFAAGCLTLVMIVGVVRLVRPQPSTRREFERQALSVSVD